MATDDGKFLKSIADRIERLRQIREIAEMPRQTVTREFAVVSPQERRIAMDAFLALAEKYSIPLEDTDAMTKAHQVLFAYGFSQLEGQWELSSEDVARKVIWH